MKYVQNAYFYQILALVALGFQWWLYVSKYKKQDFH